ncbi:uncharacterized protein CCOS01_15254 [Colletotrichum costaricense]|uniref:Secreted protein n=1 Tax=Colletotrichum costaricense TaxID=1209916 RepID=A0AAI9YHT4_9PEZI|nr:uncharacterized protein CCOS01_15254 [Colletotrichum costaricense]KAK1510423.1 hypothetical protein CCOS01_15254 [Colletotrichum costaricense]
MPALFFFPFFSFFSHVLTPYETRLHLDDMGQGGDPKRARARWCTNGSRETNVVGEERHGSWGRRRAPISLAKRAPGGKSRCGLRKIERKEATWASDGCHHPKSVQARASVKGLVVRFFK